MSTVTIDATLMEKLKSPGEVVTVVGPNGEIGGLFVPMDEYALAEACRPKISDEELLQRSMQAKGRTLDEIIRDWMHD